MRIRKVVGGASNREVGFHRFDVLEAVRRLAVEMGHWTGDDIETRRAFDISFFVNNLPARHGNVGRYRQYD